DVLAAHGWAGQPVRAAVGPGGAVELHYAVTSLDGVDAPVLTAGPAGARRTQRVGAYAVVVDRGRLLMSQLADWVAGGAGLWTLPGGGVEPGEDPLDGVVREVHEETGQDAVPGDLVQVQSSHRIGPVRADEGRSEDFHALRLIYPATCPRPTPATVVEVDGSTGATAWVPLDRVRDLALGDMVRKAWHLVPGGESYPV
ncbi:MAG: NUDIX hydrolase, partial [Janibacter sp.]